MCQDVALNQQSRRVAASHGDGDGDISFHQHVNAVVR
jgi:hypothetical protein